MTQTIIELELEDRYGKRRKRRMISSLHDHFIVCGFGRVGRHALMSFFVSRLLLWSSTTMKVAFKKQRMQECLQ